MGAWGPFPGIKRGRGVTLATYPHLVPRSRMSRSYTAPPSASVPSSGTVLLAHPPVFAICVRTSLTRSGNYTSPAEAEDFPLASVFRPALGPTQPPVHRPDDGGSTYLWNVGRQLFNTAVHPRRQIWTECINIVQKCTSCLKLNLQYSSVYLYECKREWRRYDVLAVDYEVYVFSDFKRISGTLHFSPLHLVFHSALCIFNLTRYYAILCSLHIKIKFIAFICYEICSSYIFLTTCSKWLKRSAAAGI
jgi:hypothetical protein